MNVRQLMITASHHVTWFLGTRFPNTFPFVFVTGYPKSGTTSATKLVAEYLQLPSPKFSLLPIGFEAVVHGHAPVLKNYTRGVYVMRDGRDALVSQYFFLTRNIPDWDHPPRNARLRRALPGMVNKARVHENMAPFIRRQMNKPHSSPVNWGDHVRSFLDMNHPNMVLLRYEDLLRDGETTFAQAMSKLTGEPPDHAHAREAIQKFSFHRNSGRQPGREDRASFLRKGQAGDWKNYFTREAAEIFRRFCGDALIAAGYETDHSWVEQVQPLEEVTVHDQPSPLMAHSQPQ